MPALNPEPQQESDPIPTLAQQVASAEWVPVESSNLASIAHTESRYEGVSWLYRNLFVEFKSGAVYAYLDVPRDIYLALKESGSKGKYLNESIKRTYSFQRVES